MELDQAREFGRDHHRAVMVTRRGDGGLQASPVVVGADDEGRVLVSSRETAFKVKNLRRDPKVTVTVLPDEFFGDWIQVDGSAEIVSLPEAMDLLVDYYRQLSGEHPDWDDYRKAMERERRVMVRITLERAGPDRAG